MYSIKKLFIVFLLFLLFLPYFICNVYAYENDLKKNIDIHSDQKSDWGFGLDIGSGFGKFDSGLNDYFKSENNGFFVLGVNVAFKKYSLILGMDIGEKYKPKTSFTAMSYYWDTTMDLEIQTFHLSIGYTALDRSLIKIVPFIGLNYMHISEITTEEKFYNGDYAVLGPETGYLLGVNFFFKITEKITGMTFINEYSYLYVRFTSGYILPNLDKEDDRFDGGMLYFNLAFGAFGHPVKT